MQIIVANVKIVCQLALFLGFFQEILTMPCLALSGLQIFSEALCNLIFVVGALSGVCGIILYNLSQTRIAMIFFAFYLFLLVVVYETIAKNTMTVHEKPMDWLQKEHLFGDASDNDIPLLISPAGDRIRTQDLPRAKKILAPYLDFH